MPKKCHLWPTDCRNHKCLTQYLDTINNNYVKFVVALFTSLRFFARSQLVTFDSHVLSLHMLRLHHRTHLGPVRFIKFYSTSLRRLSGRKANIEFNLKDDDSVEDKRKVQAHRLPHAIATDACVLCPNDALWKRIYNSANSASSTHRF